VRTCLEAVTARSPSYSPAWAKLSWMYGDEERFAYNRRTGAAPPFERARVAAERAVEADGASAMAHQYLAIALFHERDDVGFRAEAEQALKLNPNNSEILADVGLSLVLLDGSTRGRDMAEKAIVLNPGHPAWYHSGVAVYHLLHGDKAEALDSALQFAPDGSPMAAYVLAAAYRLNGQGARADETLAELAVKTPMAIRDREELTQSLRIPSKLASLIFG
jgi:tetratricopeptide (TPR) repeat protein